jgi:hypothetical protein
VLLPTNGSAPPERPTYVAIVQHDGNGWSATLGIAESEPLVIHVDHAYAAERVLRDVIAEATHSDPNDFDVRTIVSYNRTSLD